jgi:hypothetical protein
MPTADYQYESETALRLLTLTISGSTARKQVFRWLVSGMIIANLRL